MPRPANESKCNGIGIRLAQLYHLGQNPASVENQRKSLLLSGKRDHSWQHMPAWNADFHKGDSDDPPLLPCFMPTGRGAGVWGVMRMLVRWTMRLKRVSHSASPAFRPLTMSKKAVHWSLIVALGDRAMKSKHIRRSTAHGKTYREREATSFVWLQRNNECMKTQAW